MVSNKDDLEFFRGIVGMLLIYTIIIVIAFFVFWKPLPLVYWSYSRDECVKVIIGGTIYDCADGLPKKYEIMWVK